MMNSIFLPLQVVQDKFQKKLLEHASKGSQ